MSFYTVAISGMPSLLREIKEPLARFNRDDYEQAFQAFYMKNRATYEALENGYNQVVDKEQFIINMAQALVDSAVAEMEKLSKKSEKEELLRDLNLCMVTYVFPSILKHGGNSSRPLAENIQKFWKEAFPKTNIHIADYGNISDGFKRKFCYITTAVCETFHKPDNCYELTLLRQYRDSYLMSQEDGEEIVQEYYNLAPTIVKHINKQKKKEKIYLEIWQEYLQPCISMIENGENEACKERYIQMVRDMQKAYFSSH